ncbi:hypothetical protein [Amycolatopsis tucumanensis]|uniref:PH domain-containing protein n=1 Tax=Amycolatopsis tucumanensis TaxID=401106 RepID=A0ABP7HQM6_9PSEU|nr:hypothetical protein [Amycolatopsis tucumanensis]MCF6421186.1 hypothetical protein [Amycolatopsis tucumanensis]
MTTDPDLLGPVGHRYRVSHVRLALIAVAAVVLAAVMGALTTPMMLSGYSYQYSTAIGFGITVTVFAATLAVFLVVHVARQGLSETFEVRDAGLAHTAKGRTRAWPWQAVTAVTPFHPRRSTFLTRLVIRDYRCTVAFADGAKIRFSGALDGHELLEHAIRAGSAVGGQAPRR